MGCPDEATLLKLAQGELTDAAVREHVSGCARCRARLAAAEKPAGTVTTPMPGVKNEPELIPRGTTFDRYVILDRIGRGGMGVVYSAFDPKLDRKIALKVLGAEAVAQGQSNAAKTRLLREAQAMARLSHPNVIAVYDAGEVGDQVFIAMELVEGRTLKQWLKEQPRTWREVVQAYVAAGRGLAAAHAVEIVHRDFKPANVLIDRDGRVRVMDFGVARVAHLESDEPSLRGPTPDSDSVHVTLAGMVVGTPAYMSPEQLAAGATDARSDQFALAVSLYEGLYAERPFDKKAVDAARWEIKPPASQGHVPAWLRRALLVALERDPARRYVSIPAMLEAIEKDPWVARRRWLLAAGAVAAAAVAVIGMKQASTRQAELCTGAAQKLAGIWDDDMRAKVEKALRSSDRPFAKDTAVSVRSVLDAYGRGWADMHREACEATRLRGDQPETVFAARTVCLDQRLQELKALTHLYSTEGALVVDKAVRAAQALTPLAGCADLKLLMSAVKPPADAAAAEAVAALRARLAGAKVLQDSGRLKASLEQVTAAAADADKLGYRPVAAEAKLLLGTTLMRSGDPKGAEQQLFSAFSTADSAGHDVVAVEAASREVGVVGYILARYDEGERWGQLAQARIERMGGNIGVEAKLHNNLALIAHARARYDEALEHYRIGLALREKSIGREHPETADTISNMGSLLGEMGKFDESEALLREALDNREKVLGHEHFDLTQHLINHAETLVAMGRVAQAEEELERARVLCEKGYGLDHPFCGDLAATLGQAYSASGRHEAALEQYERAVAVRRNAFGPEHPQVAAALISIGNTQVALGKTDDALSGLAEALRIATAAQGARHPQVAEALTAIGRARVAAGDVRTGLGQLEKAVDILKEAKGGAERAKVDALLGLGEAQAVSNAALAVKTLEAALAASGTARADQRAAVRYALAKVLWAADKPRSRQLAVEAGDGGVDVAAWLSTHP